MTRDKGGHDPGHSEACEKDKPQSPGGRLLRRHDGDGTEQQRRDRHVEDELGDVLFSIVNLSRFWSVNPEDALRGTIEKFTRRFQYVEKKFTEMSRNMKDATLEEMDVYWNEAKRIDN